MVSGALPHSVAHREPGQVELARWDEARSALPETHDEPSLGGNSGLEREAAAASQRSCWSTWHVCDTWKGRAGEQRFQLDATFPREPPLTTACTKLSPPLTFLSSASNCSGVILGTICCDFASAEEAFPGVDDADITTHLCALAASDGLAGTQVLRKLRSASQTVSNISLSGICRHSTFHASAPERSRAAWCACATWLHLRRARGALRQSLRAHWLPQHLQSLRRVVEWRLVRRCALAFPCESSWRTAGCPLRAGAAPLGTQRITERVGSSEWRVTRAHTLAGSLDIVAEGEHSFTTVSLVGCDERGRMRSGARKLSRPRQRRPLARRSIDVVDRRGWKQAQAGATAASPLSCAAVADDQRREAVPGRSCVCRRLR